MDLAFKEKKDSIDPLGHGRIGGHYFHAWCPSVTKTNMHCYANVSCPENKMRATKETMDENNDYLLTGAWWVTEVSELV